MCTLFLSTVKLISLIYIPSKFDHYLIITPAKVAGQPIKPEMSH